MPAGLFWLQAGQTSTVAGVNNLRGLLFFELMFMSMRAMLGALFTFPSEFKMMLKVTHLPLLPVLFCLVLWSRCLETPCLNPSTLCVCSGPDTWHCFNHAVICTYKPV